MSNTRHPNPHSRAPQTGTPSNTPNVVKVRELCALGYEDYDSGRYSEALRLFYQAWLELPKPQSDWPESTWILSSIGDCYFRLAQFEQGCESLTSALHCPDGQLSPFIHLRLGQCQYELKQTFLAYTHLRKAYDIGGSDLFNNEDIKYRKAAKSNRHA